MHNNYYDYYCLFGLFRMTCFAAIVHNAIHKESLVAGGWCLSIHAYAHMAIIIMIQKLMINPSYKILA